MYTMVRMIMIIMIRRRAKGHVWIAEARQLLGRVFLLAIKLRRHEAIESNPVVEQLWRLGVDTRRFIGFYEHLIVHVVMMMMHRVMMIVIVTGSEIAVVLIIVLIKREGGGALQPGEVHEPFVQRVCVITGHRCCRVLRRTKKPLVIGDDVAVVVAKGVVVFQLASPSHVHEYLIQNPLVVPRHLTRIHRHRRRLRTVLRFLVILLLEHPANHPAILRH